MKKIICAFLFIIGFATIAYAQPPQPNPQCDFPCIPSAPWQLKHAEYALMPMACPTCSLTVNYWIRECGDEIQIIMAGIESATGNCNGCAAALSGLASDYVLKTNDRIKRKLDSLHALHPDEIQCYDDIKFAALSCYRWVQGGGGPIFTNPYGWHSEPCTSQGCCKYNVSVCIDEDGNPMSPEYVKSNDVICGSGCYQGCAFDPGWEALEKIGIETKENMRSIGCKITPNPTNGNVRLSMTVSEKGNYKITFSDLLGATEFEENLKVNSLSYEKEFSLDKLQTGTYLYKIMLDEKTCFTGKLNIVK